MSRKAPRSVLPTSRAMAPSSPSASRLARTRRSAVPKAPAVSATNAPRPSTKPASVAWSAVTPSRTSIRAGGARRARWTGRRWRSITGSTPPPGMEAAKQGQDRRVHMGLAPLAGGELVGLGERRIDVDGRQDRAQPFAVLHREDELGQEVARMRADNRRAEDRILSRRGEDLDE